MLPDAGRTRTAAELLKLSNSTDPPVRRMRTVQFAKPPDGGVAPQDGAFAFVASVNYNSRSLLAIGRLVADYLHHSLSTSSSLLVGLAVSAGFCRLFLLVASTGCFCWLLLLVSSLNRVSQPASASSVCA